MSTTATLRHAEAGRAGGDVRSDCRVTFEPRDSGDIELALTSRVEPYYGDSIRAQARQVLAELGVARARLTINDMGALPFVIAARIEAAVRRGTESGATIGVLHSPSAGCETKQGEPGTPKDRLRRSRLYLPGNEPKYFVNAGLHGPDAIILDLEDSVAAAEKDAARVLVRNALNAVNFNGCERMVRINQLPLGLEDIEEIIPANPDLVLIPKVETPEQVKQVAEAIERLQQRRDNGRRIIWLMPILESALGIENAFAIAKASEYIAALTIGLEDYTADIGVIKTPEGTESLYARERLANAAHAARIQAIDSVYGDIGDTEGLLAWGKRSRGLGFEGMGCVHPLQIAVIHEAFAPTADEIDKARRLVSAFEEAQSRGLGVVSVGSKMIDPPVVQRALKLVERARRMKLITDN
ncbi:MAG: aldolase/citrate lyase family protein [Terriglobales bacterium]|jgi:citrate lyase subunit beta / citryl-CoA lyase